MGTYKLNLEEVHESMVDWLYSLEDNWDAEDICKAYNKIAKKEGWKEKITLIPK